MTLGDLVVIGLGYVGLPVAAKFAEAGFNVVGIDRDDYKITATNSGISHIEGDEPQLDELVRKVVEAGRLKAEKSYESIESAEYVLIIVETPFEKEIYKPYYSALRSASKDVGKHLKKETLIVVESTLAPGTIDTIVKPIIEQESGLKAGDDFLLATAPERVMPGKLLYNLVNLDRVVGGIDEESTKKAIELYSHIVKGKLYPTDALTAEVVKTTENAYRDVQIAFANEIALLCENIGVDVWTVRELVNKSPNRNMHYPGTGVGGHCLPKDSWLLAFGTRGKYEPRLIAMARDINDSMPLHMSDLCEDALLKVRGTIHGSKVTILGVAYLENSDDTRNSPTLPLKRSLEVLGVETTIHDPKVKSSTTLPIEEDLYGSIKGADCVALATAHKEYFTLDLDRIKSIMRTPIIVDGRNVLNSEICIEKGFSYLAIGRPSKIRCPD
ncbi:MAG: UDP-N-acetyl-D-mannosamine dehydrogenase [Candidatus Thorarchaeota archaeon]|nr:MAG: UDP-N-acetyl-D-mannosamine dehydrogenase [Candidatus Thorarchaeota archaeon]